MLPNVYERVCHTVTNCDKQFDVYTNKMWTKKRYLRLSLVVANLDEIDIYNTPLQALIFFISVHAFPIVEDNIKEMVLC